MIEVTRRDFLKMCISAAILAGLIKIMGPHFKIISNILKEDPTVMPKIIWVECADCAGDTIALLDATIISNSVIPYALEKIGVGGSTEWWNPPFNSDLIYTLAGLNVDLAFHDTIRPEWGEEIKYLGKLIEPIYPATYLEILEKINEDIIRGKPEPYILVLEGALTDEVFYKLRYNGWNAVLGKRTITEWFYRLCKGAIGIIAVGSCASYGGIPSDYAPDVGTFTMNGAASHSPSGAMGVLPDPVKKQEGFIIKYREYAYEGILSQVWSWNTEERKVFTNALDPYYNFIVSGFRDIYELPLTWSANVKPIVAIPGCPANGNAVAIGLVIFLLIYLKKKSPNSKLGTLLKETSIRLPLDRFFRPEYAEVSIHDLRIFKFPLYGFRTHRPLNNRANCTYLYVTNNGIKRTYLLTGCPKFIYWRRKLLKKYPGDGLPYCAFSIGCKGPRSTCPWNAVGWIIDKKLNDLSKLEIDLDSYAGCTKKSAPCIGCVMPGFSDAYQPFFKPLRPIRARGIITVRLRKRFRKIPIKRNATYIRVNRLRTTL